MDAIGALGPVMDRRGLLGLALPGAASPRQPATEVATAVVPVVSRRQLLAGAGVLATVGLAPRFFAGVARLRTPVSGGSAPLSTGGTAPPVADLSLARFSPHVGTEFVIRVGAGHQLPVILVEATERGARPGERRALSGESFSLMFASDGDKRFDHGTYTMAHPSLGTLELFLVAVGRADRGQRYEAVVNRRTPVR